MDPKIRHTYYTVEYYIIVLCIYTICFSSATGILSCAGYNSCISNDLDKLASQLTLETPAPDQLGCCGKHGICAHEVLQDEVPGPIPRSNHKVVGRKASFKLSWGCNGDKNGQHKHDFVSFEKGDITTAERSNKQVGPFVLFNSFLNGR
jgi:hypothetical protein